MKIPLKLMCCYLWGCFFTCARGQECLRSNIKLENTEQLEKRSYSHGDIVKINCIAGYSGMYKFACKNGQWDKMVERVCTKKKCGHPGDVQNGDFRLLDENEKEFVFGVTVEYTCKKGYEMMSRINQRTCRSNGWDNTAPICEAKKCPPIDTREGMTVSGNTEEAIYSDAVHFECLSPDEKIDGKSDIHCTDKGEWSDPFPTCKEITCAPPDIPHGTVTQAEYKKDSALQYECDAGYKLRQGTPKCTKYGWSLEPQCEEITCELKETTFGIHKIVPRGLTFFRVGETVEITCSKRYRLFLSKETVKTFTCQQNGQWDRNPVCEEIRCEIPRDRRLSDPIYYFYGELKLDVKRTYWCLSGLRKMADQATCTEDGWKPDPLCADTVCDVPNIPNAQIRTQDPTRTQYGISSTLVYNCDPGYEPEGQIRITCNHPGKWTGIEQCTENRRFCATPDLKNGYIYPDPPNGESIYYSCGAGYKPFSGNWWEEARCVRGRWSDEPRCIRVEDCGAFPSVAHGQVRKTNNPDEQSAEVVCDPGFRPSHALIRCVSGTWEEPTCELDKQHCVSPPAAENAVITSKPQELYSSGSHVVYICRKDFQMTGNSKVYCNNKIWDNPPTCEAFCPRPRALIEHANLIENLQNKRKYSHGDTVRYACVDGYESRDTIARCVVHTWIYPKCIEKAQCAKPTRNVQFVTLSYDKNMFNNFDILTYTCNKPYDQIPGGTLMCANKEWNGTFDCTSRICPPPPYIENGEFISEQKSDDIIITVSYTCQNYYVLDNKQKRYYRCQNGRWESPPKCLKPCEVTPEIRKEYNLRPVPHNYVEHSDQLYLYCNPGWNVGTKGWRHEYTAASCTDGKLQIEFKCSEKNYF